MIDWGFIGNGEVDRKEKRKVTYFNFLHAPFCLSSPLYWTSSWDGVAEGQNMR